MSAAPDTARARRASNLGPLLGWIALCFVAAAIGGLFPPGAWYERLAKPSWTPPSWLFGPVWTALYVAMGVAAWRVWRPGGFAAARLPLALFGIQLALNALWTPVFFGLRDPGAALAVIAGLKLALLATMAAFWSRDTIAGVLLVPYWAWVSFAAVLNLSIWRLNVG